MNLLTLRNVSLRQVPGQWNRYPGQACHAPALVTREVRVTLMLATVIGQLENPCALIHKSAVHQTGMRKGIKRTIHGYAVHARPTHAFADIGLR